MLENNSKVDHLSSYLLLGEVGTEAGGVLPKSLLDTGEDCVDLFERRSDTGQLALPSEGQPECPLVGKVVGEVRIGMLGHRAELDLGLEAVSIVRDRYAVIHVVAERHDVMH